MIAAVHSVSTRRPVVTSANCINSPDTLDVISRERSLSVIIPAFNEALRITNTLTSTASFLLSKGYDWEIIVVDDGSQDHTSETVVKVVDQLGLNSAIKVIVLPQNRGKGAAVKAGVLASEKEYCLICDADLAVPIKDIERLWPYMDAAKTSLVIGSRTLPGSETLVQVKWYRKILGRVFNALLARLAPNIYDTQCGFKLFPVPHAKRLALSQIEEGFAFDVEYLHLALRSEWKVSEVSVNWNHMEGSKVRIFRDSVRMFVSVMHIWFRSKIGAYGSFPLEPETTRQL
jgi:dolichyl-phosphate beta-glucosyltransferase